MHLKVHMGERPFACTHCGKRFSERSYLRIHQQKKKSLYNIESNPLIPLPLMFRSNPELKTKIHFPCSEQKRSTDAFGLTTVTDLNISE
jgi:hypothetical protein